MAQITRDLERGGMGAFPGKEGRISVLGGIALLG